MMFNCRGALFLVTLLSGLMMVAIALEDCTKSTTDNMYRINKKMYDNITAAVCFSGKYDMTSWEPSNYVEIQEAKCSYKDVWGFLGQSVNKYKCFFMLGSNSFKAKTPGGYKNLAILKDDESCTWDRDQRNLTCTVP
ncbi:conserved hypothetical Ustilaginaceae-specific protein [Sporisorium reilianum SRZ2]|uniref:Conserved hypothetical Ustilaginaceae-specific protein n=1 Tax=Sporisorium reilianum (strain SRZ2) TaxID=999809 RepID=E7A119_SPORE|nr:conserved hypothetical Ustilaginaceae-specific protein [Sporisorium reilianum SRZ2]